MIELTNNYITIIVAFHVAPQLKPINKFHLSCIIFALELHWAHAPLAVVMAIELVALLLICELANSERLFYVKTDSFFIASH